MFVIVFEAVPLKHHNSPGGFSQLQQIRLCESFLPFQTSESVFCCFLLAFISDSSPHVCSSVILNVRMKSKVVERSAISYSESNSLLN